jgi:hypothetical protein
MPPKIANAATVATMATQGFTWRFALTGSPMPEL